MNAKSVFPMWVFVAVALGITAISFTIGQFFVGLGMAFAAGASTVWTTYAADRRRRLRP